MGENIRKLAADASNLKSILLHNQNISILLYLAKYNPKVSKKDISLKFGRQALDGLKALAQFQLVKEEEGNLTLTTEGIFQVEGLLSAIAH